MVIIKESNLRHIIIFRKPTDKTWVSQKNHHTMETFIEATNNELDEEIPQIKSPKNCKPSKGEQKALDDLPERNNIVIVNSVKGRILFIMYVIDYTEKSETQLHNKGHYHQLSKHQTKANHGI